MSANRPRDVSEQDSANQTARTAAPPSAATAQRTSTYVARDSAGPMSDSANLSEPAGPSVIALIAVSPRSMNAALGSAPSAADSASPAAPVAESSPQALIAAS